MDVTFETTLGHQFTLEIWYFSTVKRIKEYIMKYEGIPMESQRLFFMGKELQDDHDTEYYSILEGSHILIAVRNCAKTHDSDIKVVVSVASLGRNIRFKMKASDTVARLKELIQEHTNGALQADQVRVFLDKVQMEEGKALADYNLPSNRMEVRALVTQPPQQKKAQWMTVKVKRGSQMVILEMSDLDVAKDLRTELRRVAPHFLNLVDGGNAFVYKQNAMDEDRTLRWHKVKNGDTIEILNNTAGTGAQG